MQEIIDFTNSYIVPRKLGDSSKKIRVKYDDKFYILKFAKEKENPYVSDIKTSFNTAISEYISSHIFQSVGIDTNNTLLGVYNDELCVACEDFRTVYEENIEFSEFARTIYDPDEFEKSPGMEQLYEIYECNAFPYDLKEKAIERFWDMFVVDALVGNYNRNASNWGVLLNTLTDSYKLAPVYGLGRTLFTFPYLSDEASWIISNDFEMLKKGFAYPFPSSPNKTDEFFGYYDILSSNCDNNCSKALVRIFPRIDMNKIFSIVDNTPYLSEERKGFYKKVLQLRYEAILERAYNCCVTKNFDKDAQYRIQNKIFINDTILEKMMTNNCFKNVSALPNADKDAEHEML